MENELSRTEAAKMLHINEDSLRDLCKEHLKFREHYRPHCKDGVRITPEGLGILKAVTHPNNVLYVVDTEDDVINAIVANSLPPNMRRLWILVPGVDGKCDCNIPPRFAKMFRQPKKRIRVRKVDDGLYQFAGIS